MMAAKPIKAFLDLIVEMATTSMPILLGDEIPLFHTSNLELKFEHLETDIYYRRAG